MKKKKETPSRNYSSYLNKIKLDCSLVDVYPLISDSTLAKLVSAWRKIKVEWKPPMDDDLSGRSEYDIWESMWEYCDWDFLDLSIALELSEEQVLIKHNQARKLRLIFPDGEILREARKVLEMEVKSFSSQGKIEFLLRGGGGDFDGKGGDFDA